MVLPCLTTGALPLLLVMLFLLTPKTFRTFFLAFLRFFFTSFLEIFFGDGFLSLTCFLTSGRGIALGFSSLVTGFSITLNFIMGGLCLGFVSLILTTPATVVARAACSSNE